VAFGADGKAKDGSGLVFDDWRNWLLLQSWITDKRAGLSHIFVSRPLKARLLAFARKRPAYKKHVQQALRLLKEPKNADAHDDHFHVRIACPKRQSDICREEPRRR
jgi:penicillin-insensitive murein endopeptidase